jgi:hypothetical protein
MITSRQASVPVLDSVSSAIKPLFLFLIPFLLL